jgi:hypothetical protein
MNFRATTQRQLAAAFKSGALNMPTTTGETNMKPTYNELLTLLDACSEAVEEAAKREARKGTNEYGLKNITWKLRLERVHEILKAADFEA